MGIGGLPIALFSLSICFLTFSFTMLFFLPLMFTIFMYRDYDIDSLITLLITFYIILISIILVLWFVFGFNWVLDFLEKSGINVKNTKGSIIRRKDK